jgi:hypothetical protein
MCGFDEEGLAMSSSNPDSHATRLSFRSFSGRGKVKPSVLRRLIVQAVLAIIAASTMSLPVLAQSLGSPTFVTGTATATITVTFTVAPAAGSTVSCSLTLISNDPRGPSDTNSTTATVSGSSASCPITINYNWRLTSSDITTDTMTIAYSVSGPAQTSSGLVNVIAMPASGATTGPMNIAVTQ